MSDRFRIATLAGGCFWCLEAVFQRLEGVEKVVSGYTGGNVAAPSYEEVCSGRTGHAEAVRIHFDPTRIGYAELLEVFWRIHDPTSRDRQGADVGTQYRSAIFCHDDEQRRLAEASRQAQQASGYWPDPIVTEILPAGPFYPAEAYHQDYYRSNAFQPYCRMIIQPKLQKLQKNFPERLKPTPA